MKHIFFLTDVGYLNRKHRYYIQIQGQLMISGLLFCMDSVGVHSRMYISGCEVLRESRKAVDHVFCNQYAP